MNNETFIFSSKKRVFAIKKIIKSSIDFASEVDIEKTFRNYYYVMIVIKFLFEKKMKNDYLNIKCFITLMNRVYFIKIYLEMTI